MKREDFLDVWVLQNYITKRKEPGAVFSQGRVFQFDAAYKMGYKIRLTYAEDAPTHTCKLQKSKARTYKEDIFSLHTVNLVPKYTALIPLTAEKIKSLLEHIAPRSKGKYFEDILRQQESASSGLHDQLLDEDDPDDHLLEFD
ncbi:hypothetical protein Pcinc_008030 [Petrolisthes cinctipes]|uniref:Uncharacterized protein n=1 Tax=Petrolisthes cinctipes TaxID=88211 RepID=A0AAE1G889_PETCI|nr:hypothetical protein Pcinc_008030 [Petrolisthes cinctipes]